MRIIIGAPGNGAVLKEALKEELAGDERVSALVDLSTPDITYPEISFRAGRAIAEGRADRGILVCGTGIGMALAADKVAGVRAANIVSVKFAELCREHNDANVLALSGRFVDLETNERILDAFFSTDFAGGRHAGRVEKIMKLEGTVVEEA